MTTDEVKTIARNLARGFSEDIEGTFSAMSESDKVMAYHYMKAYLTGIKTGIDTQLASLEDIPF
jgi:hypothetical protein